MAARIGKNIEIIKEITMMLGIGQSGKSWKTTLFGGVTNIIFGAGMIAVAIIIPMAPVISTLVVSAGIKDISNGIAFLFAKDNDVTGVPNAMNTKYLATTPLTSDPIIRDPIK